VSNARKCPWELGGLGMRARKEKRYAYNFHKQTGAAYDTANLEGTSSSDSLREKGNSRCWKEGTASAIQNLDRKSVTTGLSLRSYRGKAEVEAKKGAR